ncbi:TIR domain-containing protein [Pseudomonas sp. SJZ103]|jgi:hypothetical protein|uniref:toll/interleukin-1 receptor domain-containing protein n=1 Tax=Pseudomonas TaxID=286 RepID=UPI00070E194E|nr:MULTISPECIES: toll/interleukin-1 receptor domain-containing protein [unclassified Pseudomonas]TWC70151.1 TIR domain-containing protein [Pseudomonas sp. SJZ103]TWC87438.1 TIR domain-containing protein [Pseudomonas sp. SJZ094]
MKRVLTVGLRYNGEPIDGVEFDNLGLCGAAAEHDKSAYPLYEYDVIIINPASFSHFLFGEKSEFSASPTELGDLKQKKGTYDIDTVFDALDRRKEMEAAIKAGATVVWCLSEAKRMNFFGYRETWLGYVAPPVSRMVKSGDLLVKKGRRLGDVDPDSPFTKYFASLASTGWNLCLGDEDIGGYTSIASSPEGYSLGGRVSDSGFVGWLVTPPSSDTAANRLILDSLEIVKDNLQQEKYHGIFLSHTGADKPFVRQLRKDLMEHGVPQVWVDEAEIEIGDSLIGKITEGMKETRYIGVVLSSRSIDAPWVKKELDIAINREISGGEVVVLPLLYEKCTIPTFLEGKLYADFTSTEEYETALAKLLRKLRIH